MSTSATRIEEDLELREPFIHDEDHRDARNSPYQSTAPGTRYNRRFWPLDIRFDIKSISMRNFKPIWLRPQPERRLHATSYLDGIRGLAAFFVFLHHSVNFLFPEGRYAYGAPEHSGIVNHSYFFQLPVFRTFMAGAAMVDLFFVISGAVLAIKPLRLIREDEPLQVFENLSSATIRRGLRLYLPCMFATFVIAILCWMGAPADTPTAHKLYRVAKSGRLSDQIWLWMQDMVYFTAALGRRSGFERGTWTIPFEWRCSMVVFLCVLGVANVRSPIVRTAVLIFLQISWCYLDYWDMFLFVSGVVIADLSLYRQGRPVHSRKIKLLHILAFVVGLYLLSIPERGEAGSEGAPFGQGWLMNSFYPSTWTHDRAASEFWPCIGAIIFVGTVTHAGPDSWSQKFFNARFIQYLGEISFSFYLYHPIIIHSIGSRLMPLLISITGDDGHKRLFCLVLTLTMILPIIFYVAQLATDHVDKNSVKFARWLFKR